MKLSEYVKQLSKMLEEHPHLADAEVCYASDDEGNNYSNAVFDPSIRYRLTSDEGYSFDMQLMNKMIQSLLKCIKTSSFLSS